MSPREGDRGKKTWAYRHSLSIFLFGFSCATTLVSRYATQENGGWPYDFWMGIATGSWVTLVLILAARKLWERGADPAQEPEK
jgi:uncharacterized membrane protein